MTSLRTSTQPVLRGLEKLASFLREQVFSKNTSLHAPIPLNKRLTFAKMPDTEKPGEKLKARAAEMERSALKAVIDLVEVCQLVDLTELMEHLVVKECMALFNSNSTYRKTEEQAHPVSAICRSAGTLHRSHRHGHDLEDGNSISRRSTDAIWHPMQVVGLRPQGVINRPCPPW